MKTGLFTGMSNEQLVDRYVITHEEEFFEELLSRTKMLRYSIVKKYSNIPGVDSEDLVSEGLMETFKAVKNFDSSKGVLFTTFLYSAISRRYNKLFTKATCEKNLGESFTESYDQLCNTYKSKECSEEYRDYGNIIFSVECPEYGMIELMDVIERAELSERERVTIQLTLRGNTKPEIAKYLNVTTPTVHSYLRRVYNKLRLAIA